MARPLKIAKSSTIDIGFPNNGTTNNGFNGNGIGVVGGDDVSLNLIVRVKIGSNSETDGYILRQKAKRKFLVTDGVNTGVCTIVDESNGNLNDNEMTVTGTSGRLATLTNKWAVDFSGTKYLLSFFNSAAAGATDGTDYAMVSVDNND